ncbi:cysteine-rich RLK (RECEPTOR-like protein kinase) 34 [Actinidia rufa]|uniref:non-specific serine/threonine protein kinase n=1 Tax=Actinidia rufa TaxID=165716 RepID=A0A7J0G673_9ERIC|nr:cysteine-rich RLK (RECEPTOR-like protein kinase) 34 [Actinidia rufa]
MSSSRRLFLIYQIFLINLVGLTQAQPDLLGHFCNHTSNIIYQANLNNLLSSLSAKTNQYGFYSASLGEDPDTAHAIVLCRADADLDTCRGCIDNSTRKLTQLCPNAKEAIGWYDYCMLRYSNVSMQGVNDFVGKTSSPGSFRGDSSKICNGEHSWSRLGNRTNKIRTVIIIVVPILSTLLLLVLAFSIYQSRKKHAVKSEEETQSQSVESLKFDFATLRAATNDFSNANMLGHGGFGSVYKGKLLNGQEIAVNRLADCSGQDPIKRMLLDWELRYKIIVGTAHGLLYLHQDSQLSIIHHDLKAANVLLDSEKNAKIADFGMASGYMPPEYANYGKFSVKTDVFSFGVLILEIVSGKKNSGFRGPEHAKHLISYAWKKWRQGKASRLIDPTIKGGSKSEKTRCIHIGLLCVQENVAKRPTMDLVVLMLNSFSMSLQSPTKPAFLMDSSSLEPNTALPGKSPIRVTSSDQSPKHSVNLSVNEASITDPCPR